MNKDFPHFEVHGEYDPRHISYSLWDFEFPLVTFCLLFERFDVLDALLEKNPHVGFGNKYHCPIKALLAYGDGVFQSATFGFRIDDYKSYIGKDKFISILKKLLELGAAKGKERKNVWLPKALKGRYRCLELFETLLPYCDPFNIQDHDFIHNDPLLFALMDRLYDGCGEIDDLMKIAEKLLDIGECFHASELKSINSAKF